MGLVVLYLESELCITRPCSITMPQLEIVIFVFCEVYLWASCSCIVVCKVVIAITATEIYKGLSELCSIIVRGCYVIDIEPNIVVIGNCEGVIGCQGSFE